MGLVRNILDKLSSRPKIGGLEISDSALAYVFLGKEGPTAFSLRLTPGVLKEGKIERPDELLRYLRELHRKVSLGKTAQKFKVVVSLPAALIYTQSFNVPKIDKERLEEATQLNLQIISPIEAGAVYASSQVINETDDRYDLLGAFVEKETVLKLKQILSAAGFDALIFEFPSLALARAISRSFRLPPSPILVLRLSSDGLDFFILKENSLYFEYFRSWRSIQGEAREISTYAFQEAVAEEVKRVIDFSLSRFKEKVKQALVVAPGFESDITALLKSRFELEAVPLSLKSYPLAPNWYTVLGSAIRGAAYSGRDTEINLSGERLSEVFYKERLLNFIKLWRSIIIGAAVILFFTFGILGSFLVRQSKILTARLNAFKAQVSQNELNELEAKVSEFNYLVKEVERIKKNFLPWHQILSRLKELADENNVILDGLRIDITSGAPVSLAGRAPSTAYVLKFKNVLAAEPNLINVDLPLAGITTLEDNSVSFSLSFQIQ